MMLAASLLLVAQIREEPDITLASTLRTGEIVRYFKLGGRTRFGRYIVMVAATERKIYVKTAEYADTLEMTSERRRAFSSALSNDDVKTLFFKARTEDYPHRAVDGTDVFLQAKGFKWDNYKFHAPDPLPALIQLLDVWVEEARPRA